MLRFLFLILFPLQGVCEELEPYWEYGLGLGYVRYEQYPAAAESSELVLPFPTFQYRGQTLRADDREGAKVYLWKKGDLSLEISGTGTLSLDSDDNQRREGMKDIPWVLALGPQFVVRPNSSWDFSLGAYQAVATDFQMTKASGAFLEAKTTYHLHGEWDEYKSYTKYFLTLKSASQEIQQLYYGVSKSEAKVDRPFYKARSGLLALEASVFQSLKKGRTAFYVGGNYIYYGLAENRASPLHRATHEFNMLFGLSYVLGESSRPEVPVEDTSGVINKLKMK